MGSPNKRSRSNDGHRSSLFKALPLDSTLFARLLAEFHEPLKRARPRVFHGPKPSKPGPPSSISDEQVLAVRRMREWAGMSMPRIAEVTGLKLSAVEGLCLYRNRVHLDPGPCPDSEA